MSNLTPAQKAAITRNKKAVAAAQLEVTDAAADDISNVGEVSDLDNVLDTKKSYLKVRDISGNITLIQDGCKFDCNGKPLSLVEE